MSGALQRCSKVCPADPWLLEHHAREVDEFLEPAAKRQKVLAEGAGEQFKKCVPTATSPPELQADALH